MRLTSFTDYSLRVLIFLAADPARRSTIGEIAGSFGISEHHLVKVVHFLGRQGWVETVRGKGGGIQLAKAAADINIGQVVRDTEGLPVPAECFLDGGGACVITHCCQLAGVLGQAVKAFYAVLDGQTLADITENRAVLRLVLIPPDA